MKTKTPTRSPKKALETPVMSEKETTMNVNVAPRKLFVILALIVLLGGLLIIGAKKYKSIIIAGKVNGKPITRWELEKALNARYAKSTFDDLAGNVLVQQLTAQNQVTVTDDEVNKEIDATTQRLGGKEALQATLDRMGYTNTRFQDEMRIQVLVKKLAEKVIKVEITDDEIMKFFQDNKTLFPKKTFDEAKEDIRQNLLQQKTQQQFTAWFQDQKKKASIQSYL